jgi:hypothetical protein
MRHMCEPLKGSKVYAVDLADSFIKNQGQDVKRA